MKRRVMAALFVCALASIARAAAADAPAFTATGIPLDKPWKATIYAFAQKHFLHPAWGWQHSERDYRLATQIAEGDGLKVDSDVLFAAAMMHDMAAYAPWATPDVKTGKVEHGDVAATDCVPILRDAGFPMEKIAAVQAAESGHMYYSKATLPEAIALHDADSVDFLGAMGAARMIATVGEEKPSASRAIATLRSFIKDIPPRLYTKTGQKLGAERVVELTAFLNELDAESYGGKGI